MYLFVTVGSTKFDELIEFIDNEEFHFFLKKKGFEYMTIQIGNGTYVPKLIYKNKEDNNFLKKVNYFTFKNSLDDFYERADLILSHAGAGTTIECLRKKKKILIVVNTNLMNNHQMEFAEYMYSCNYLEMCKDLNTLKDNIHICLKKKYKILPKPNVQNFLQDLKVLMNK
ncbi:glycosyltransferase family 28 protein, putative [Plasmodium relictum]|uniref:UDP-N-acetylglucosamine transferase subunit ALG13 n=1 Tax=Plasmodium relictum TaxID=85471 RepID=A0A1J1H4V8_PLARL|nr:glycosyltransferase family 28 protein, putative [Plasmodium relictum]CRG98467.1 glycosyltransferase family 28 protein, putative [Plasmodium relictum]